MFSEGQVVVQQGAPGNVFYVVESGTFEICIDGGPAAPLDPTTFRSFGELALLFDAPRAATVHNLRTPDPPA